MASKEYIAKLEASLTKEDWQYINFATQVRFNNARPKKGEATGPSKEFAEQERRILSYLSAKAFS
jgi:hypothetical protein